MWRYHFPVFLALAAVLCGGFFLAYRMGVPKSVDIIDWYDVLGEGITLLVACGWLLLVLCSRPAGRVTYCLAAGSSLLIWSYFLDLLDEFLRYPDTRLLSLLESIPAPFGMVLLTLGVAGWMREQRIVNRQLTGREHFLRDHRLLDPLTKLYSRTYLQFALEREIQLRRPGEHLSLLVIDIEGFSRYNHRHGAAAGDRLLVMLAEWILMRMRSSDLLCRYGGDRFVMLLPDTTVARAERLGRHLRRRFAGLGEDAESCSLRYSAHSVGEGQADQVLADTMEGLAERRHSVGRPEWNPA